MELAFPGRETVSIRSIEVFSGCSRVPIHASANSSMSAAVERIDPAPMMASTSQRRTGKVCGEGQ
jgi:hypothetical protein